tara:strand:- start:1352 stop:3046 length:1695 start_codon:yes stop_codon:yes gene_type:complete
MNVLKGLFKSEDSWLDEFSTEEDAKWLNKFALGGTVEEDCVGPDCDEEIEEEVLKNTPPPNSSNLIRKYKKEESNKNLQDIHKSSGGSCLAGSLNCFTKSSENENYGFVSEHLPGYPSMRSYLEKGDISKYKKNDVSKKDIVNFVPNQSIDAWEIHDYLRKEGLGKPLFEGVEFTYKKNKNIPDQILENPSLLPIGTIIGQGKVKNKIGYSKYKASNPETENSDNRHAITVIGYDEKDGMPIVYDYGEERRLNDLTWKNIGRADHYTVPNEYANLTYKNIKNVKNRQTIDLGFSDKTKNKVSLGSDWKPIKAIEKGVNKHLQNIGQYYNVKKSTLEKFAKFLPGLSNKETKLNNNDGTSADKKIPTSITDSLIGNKILKPTGKWLDNLYSDVDNWASNLFSDEKEEESKQDWEIEIEAYKKHPKNTKKRESYFNTLRKLSPKKESKSFLESSVGAFKIKDESKYFKTSTLSKEDLYGITVSNLKELENGSVAALSLLTEKYKQVKEIHKDLTEDQYVKLAIIGYSNNSKMINKDFVKYYIKGDSLKDNTFEKIKNYKYNTPRKK